MKKNLIRAVGLAATVLGFGLTLVTEWVDKQETQEMIRDEVEKALAEKNENYEES